MEWLLRVWIMFFSFFLKKEIFCVKIFNTKSEYNIHFQKVK